MFVNFKWQQTQRGYKYDRLIDNESYKEVVNHFENNNCLTNKEELFRNLESHCLVSASLTIEKSNRPFAIDSSDVRAQRQ